MNGAGRWFVGFGLVGLLLVGLVLWNQSSDNTQGVAGTEADPTTTTTRGPTTTTAVGPPFVIGDVEVVGGQFGPVPLMVPDVVEQPLELIEALSLPQREIVLQDAHLDANSHGAIGQLAGTPYLILSASGIGTFPNAPDEGLASVCYWIAGYPSVSMAAVDCFGTTTTERPVPLWSGIEEVGIYAWSGLPNDAALAVLTVDGRDVLWQRPLSGVAAFVLTDAGGGSVVELEVRNASGDEIATGDRTPSIVVPEEPPTGYKDYSGVALEDIDWPSFWVEFARCVTEHGVDTQAQPDGFSSEGFLQDPELPERLVSACFEGMGRPEMAER